MIDWNTAKCWQGKCNIVKFEEYATDVVRLVTMRSDLTESEAMAVLAFMCRPEDAKVPLIAAALAEGAKS